MAEESLFIVLIAGALVAVFLVLWLHRPRGRRPDNPSTPRVDDRQTVLIDGSNVIHWLDNTPQLTPLLQVVHDLSSRGLKPGVVFDANVGYKLTGAFMGERELSRLLSLPRDQILVVPKGTQADPFLLETARDLKARIVTNDRYRDWTDRYPDVAQPDKLIRGEMRDGRVWLKGIEKMAEEKEGAGYAPSAGVRPGPPSRR